MPQSENSMSVHVKEILKRVLKFVVAFGLIGYMVYAGYLDFSVFNKLLTPTFITGCLILAGMNIMFANARWVVLLQARGFATNFRETFPLGLIGLFFNYALPGAVGGDVVKGYYIAQDHHTRKMDAVTSVVMDRIVGLYGMVVMAILALTMDLNLVLENLTLRWVALSTLALFIAMTSFFAIAFSKRLRSFATFEQLLQKLPAGGTFLRVYDAVHSYGHSRSALTWALILSFLAQVTAILFVMLIGLAVGDTSIPLTTFLFAVPLGFIISAVPVAPAGLGVGQLAFLFLFQLHSGQETQLGQTSITAFQITLLVWGLLGAFFYMKRKRPVMSEVTR